MKYVEYGVRELQAQIGKALHCIQRGERILITSRRRPVAVMAGIEASFPRESSWDRKRRRLAAEGKLKLGDPAPIVRFRVPRIGGLSAQVLADRR